uniref:Mesothelin a n=1 Tax=Oryzias melastigma TaxID=30732 RepID=A0A3B3CGL3_ORYME
KIIENVPDELATEIPRVYLQQFTSDNSTIIRLNKKTWKRQQVGTFICLLVKCVDILSSSVLQGFTCTGVGLFGKGQINKLVKACRRKGTKKVSLKETQLTCMYNHIRGETDVTDFSLYPPDVLLYYDYSLVPQSSCRSYFQELADADFSVFSSVLSYKQTALFNNARSCLGITSTSLTADQVSVLGNMCCMLEGSYIQNSDPSILDKLNNCPDLTTAQAAAVTTLLTNGNTKYGAPSTWNGQTLIGLDMLPLYLPSNFYDNFDKVSKCMTEQIRFHEQNLSVSRKKRRNLKAEIRKSIQSKSKRATDCTVGTISQVTISDTTFPFDYDVTQFNNCLTAKTVKDNFDAITAKVDEVEYLQIVLQKLSIIPEDQVQALGPASRVATTADINSWTITQVDTLASLMDSSNGDWDPSLYLAVTGNTLGRAELNAIGGSNLLFYLLVIFSRLLIFVLCREADALNVTSCTTEKKQELFSIASQSFRTAPSASHTHTQTLTDDDLDFLFFMLQEVQILATLEVW